MDAIVGTGGACLCPAVGCGCSRPAGDHVVMNNSGIPVRICDECHEASGDSWEDVLGPARAAGRGQ